MPLPAEFKDLELLASRPQTVQRDEFGAVALYSFEETPIVTTPLGDGNRGVYLPKLKYDNARKVIAKIFETEQKWRAHLEHYKKFIANLHKASLAFNSLDTKSNQELSDLFKEWVESYKDYGLFILSPFVVEQVIDPKLLVLLEDKYGSDGDQMFQDISSPSKLNEYQKIQIDLFDHISQGKISGSDFKELATRHGWYNEYSYIEPLWDASYFKKEAEKFSKESAEEEKNKILNDISHNKKAFEETFEKLQGDERLFAEIIHTYTFMRTDRVEQFKIAQVRVRPFYEHIGKLLSKDTSDDWSLEYVVALSNNELVEYLESGSLPDRKLIEIRKNQKHVYYYENDQAYFIYDDAEVKEILDSIEGDSAETEITGRSAFKGVVKGRVALVFSKQDLGKVKEGDILVARTTMPDYTPAMRIAGGFVTDEGGITSHAAIVARELSKPCIVGTGNCTKVLKDGMEVEVDADNGVVRII